MLTEPQKLFLVALRSGDFVQTTGKLREGDSYCCLGVACEVYRKTTGIGEWITKQCPEAKHTYLPHFINSYTYLPAPVAVWLNSEENPILHTDEHGQELTAADLNDDEGWDFEQIADAFEKYFKKTASTN